jgi:hypothetical protein
MFCAPAVVDASDELGALYLKDGMLPPTRESRDPLADVPIAIILC